VRGVEIRLVSGALGAEVRGLDLASLDEGVVSTVRDLVHEHLVVFFLDQDLSVSAHQRLGESLGDIVANSYTPSVDPEHPGVTHYLIHSYDYPPLAHFALAAARSYARIAPSSAHALHMPSHIFTRLGLWGEDVATNIKSENAAKDYARKNHLTGAWDEQLHAMDYLAYAYLQQAHDREARARARACGGGGPAQRRR